MQDYIHEMTLGAIVLLFIIKLVYDVYEIITNWAHMHGFAIILTIITIILVIIFIVNLIIMIKK